MRRFRLLSRGWGRINELAYSEHYVDDDVEEEWTDEERIDDEAAHIFGHPIHVGQLGDQLSPEDSFMEELEGTGDYSGK